MTGLLPPAVVLAVAVALGAMIAVASGPLLRSLPTSVGDSDSLGPDQAPDYAALATRRFAVACGAVGLAASALGLSLAPVRWLALWLVWATVFALLVAVDAMTTWLPLSLTRLVWGAGAAALLVATGVGLLDGRGLGAVGRVLLGAALAGLLYGGMWRLGHGLGFGDVRISPVLGALGASLSWSGWWLAMVAGPALGALWALGRAATGRRGPFAYGPWMWLGPAVALVAHAAGPGA